MKAGIYYIGDPCYLFDQSWQKILDETNYLKDGEHIIFGETVFCGSTAYGDGCCKDNFGRRYGVDAGLVGILPVSLLDIDKKVSREEVKNSDYMHIVEMKEDFDCSVHKGVFRFGDIKINTRDVSDEIEEGEGEE